MHEVRCRTIRHNPSGTILEACCLTRTDQIAHRLMGLIRHQDRCQFTGSVHLGKVDRVPPVSFEEF
jgi:hypothetical protein